MKKQKKDKQASVFKQFITHTQPNKNRQKSVT